MSQYQKSNICLTGKRWIIFVSMALSLIFLTMPLYAAKPTEPGGGGKPSKDPSCTITLPTDDPVAISAGDSISFTGQVDNGTTPYAIIWELPGSDLNQTAGSITVSGGTSTTSPTYSVNGTYTATFNATDDRGNSCSDSRTVEVGNEPPPPVAGGSFSILAANDLGMHCADLDYQIFSILPPFNVVHAQVIQKGTGDTADTLPKLLTDADVDVVYFATSSDLDPQGSGSINTTSDPNEVYKTNFWDLTGTSQIADHPNTIGGLAYAPLYPSVLAGALLEDPVDLSGLCNTVAFPDGCPSILNLFEALALETGIPVPDIHALSGGVLKVGQQKMPGPFNTPQHFDRFDASLPFFEGFPFGYTVANANWFAADGIPILPIDDNGNPNSYPLMRIQAIDKTDPTNVASVDIVLPVASEADCQACHVATDDPALAEQGFNGNGAAADFLITPDISFDIEYTLTAPGTGQLNKLQNAAKINVLRLHDAKHWDKYKTWDNGVLVSAPCDLTNASDPNCLINQVPLQCSQCHYSPALDLAQAGPVDAPEQGPRGRQQLHHISQSRAMHSHHGQFAELFPEMPGPNDPLRLATAVDHFVGATDPLQTVEDYVLEKTCYSCHPGKVTQCLRGAMFNGGSRCQDCHGNMEQVGNDFTENFPNVAGDMDLSKRVSWAKEPGCQSCHTGDAVNNLTADHSDVIAADGIRLLQAYVSIPHTEDGSNVAAVIDAPLSRFAENQDLYRLSQGHGGVKCEACHGSTHAIWPVINPPGAISNDNLASIQLQGHEGKIQECDVCHERGADGNLSMPLSLDGPHGMHPVGDSRWNHEHRNFTGGKNRNCTTCHGQDLTGTVLSAVSADRVLDCKSNQGDFPECAAGEPIALVTAGTQIGCGNCHKQK